MTAVDVAEAAVRSADVVACSVLSGNRNFEGRVHPEIKMNFLASPPLVVAYALAGTVDIDLTKDPIGDDINGEAVYLRDIWPTQQEVREAIGRCIHSSMFEKVYRRAFEGDANLPMRERMGTFETLRDDVYPRVGASRRSNSPPAPQAGRSSLPVFPGPENQEQIILFGQRAAWPVRR